MMILAHFARQHRKDRAIDLRNFNHLVTLLAGRAMNDDVITKGVS